MLSKESKDKNKLDIFIENFNSFNNYELTKYDDNTLILKLLTKEYIIKSNDNCIEYDIDITHDEDMLSLKLLVDTVSQLHDRPKKLTYDVISYADLDEYKIDDGLELAKTVENRAHVKINLDKPLKLIDASVIKNKIQKEKERKAFKEKIENHMNNLGDLSDVTFGDLSSKLINKDEKNNYDLVIFVKYAYENNWGYVWGSFGNVLTESYLSYSINRNDYNKANEQLLRSKSLNNGVVDCVGLLKAYGWYNPYKGSIEYASNNVADKHTDGFFNDAKTKGKIDSLPETPGLIVWFSGHVGVYIGNGKVIEAVNIEKGIKITNVNERNWTHWFEMPGLTYYYV